MSFTFSGQSGELLRGGRVVAKLGAWHMQDQGDQSVITAPTMERNELWLVDADNYEVRLTLGKSIHRAKNAAVSITPTSVIITVKGELSRYA